MVYFSSVKLKGFGDCILNTVVFAPAVLMDECSNSHTYSSAAICIKLDTGMKKVPCESGLLVVSLLSSPAS